MGYQQDQQTPCDDPECPGQRATIYVYNDSGECVEQQMYPCDTCGNG
jgi:hypothetical protein